MADETVTIRFDGTADGLLAAAKQVSGALGKVSDNTTIMAKKSVTSGVIMAGVFTTLAASAIKMSKDVIGSFGSIASETRKMQAVMGGSAEEMSQLRFAAEEIGVSSSSVTRGFALLSSHLVKNDDAAKKLGVSYKNLDGSLKSPTVLLGEVADKLNTVEKGAEKATIAKQLFGRGFAELLPLMSQGSKGMAELAKEADAFGLTLTQKDLVAAKQFSMAADALGDGLKGLAVTIGSAIMPTLAAFAILMEDTVKKIRAFFVSNSALVTGVKIFAGVIGIATLALGEYLIISKVVALTEAAFVYVKGALGAVTAVATVATEGATVAQWGLNAAMDANPIGVVILALQLFVGALIIMVKKFEPVRKALIWLGELFGTVIGKGVSIAVRVIEYFGLGWINLVRIVVKGAEVMTGNRVWKTLFGGEANKNIKGALDALDDFQAKFVTIVNKISDTAWNKGGDIGKGLATGIVNGIKNLKLPSFKMPTTDTGDTTPMPDIPDDTTSSEAKEKAAFEKKLEATKDFWEKKIRTAEDVFKTAKAIADKAKEEMRQIAENVGRSVSSGFDITAITASSFAKYLGADALIASFRKKLTDAKEFVVALKSLKSQGLPVEMLQQIAAAGVEGGLDTARLLVGNAGAIEELKGLQVELNVAAGEAGETVSTAVMGQTVSSTQGAADIARLNLTAEERGAGQAGVVVNETTNANGDINITVQTVTNASPSDIADAIAFSIITNTPAVISTPSTSETFSDLGGLDLSGINFGGFSAVGVGTL